MWRWLLLSSLLVIPNAWADTAPGVKVQNSLGWSLDKITDPTNIGTVTGTDVSFTNLVSCGVVRTDANGNFSCGTASGTGTVTSITQGTNMSFSVNPITATGTINLTASPSVTNLTASGTVTGAVGDFSGQLRSGILTTGYVKSNAGGVLGTQATPIPVTDGGTAASTLTSNGVLYGNGTSAIQATAQGGSNTVLTANAGVPSFSATPTVTSLTANSTVTGTSLDISKDIKLGSFDRVYLSVNSANVVTGTSVTNCADSGGQHLNYNSTTNTWSCGTTGSSTAHNFLSSTHTDTVATSPTRGDLVVANSTPSWARFAVGGSNTVLTANGTDPAWSATPTVTNLTATGTVTGAVVSSTGALQVGSDYVSDITGTGLSISAGALTVGNAPTATALAANGSNCSAGNYPLGVDASGNVESCTAATTGTVTSITQGTNMSFSVTPITATGTINLAASPSVTNLTASGTVTGAVVSATGAIQVGSDYVNDITGNDLTVSGGGLSVSNSARDRTIGTFCGGTMSTTMNCEEARAYNPSACTLQKFEVALTTAPTGQSLVIDPLECPTAAGCYPILPIASRPTVTANSFSAEVITTGITVAAGDYFGLNVLQVGSGTAGSNMALTTVCRY